MPRRIRYYFGRFNLVANYDDKLEYVTRGLTSPAVVTKRGQNWQFLEVNALTADLGPFLTGFLAKYKSTADEEIAVPLTQGLDDQTIENLVVAKSRFFLHMTSGLIAYHPVGSDISRSQFRSRFAELFEAANQNFFVGAEIQSIQEGEKLREAMKALGTIRSVRIYLHPSNPSLRDVWKRTDQRLKGLRAVGYQEHFQAAQSGAGLRITDDEDVDAKIIMAEDGYGKVTVSGVKDGEELSISTDDNPANGLAPPDDVASEGVLGALMRKFQAILARFSE